MTLEEFETELQKKINESVISELEINKYVIVSVDEQELYFGFHGFEIDHESKQIILKYGSE